MNIEEEVYTLNDFNIVRNGEIDECKRWNTDAFLKGLRHLFATYFPIYELNDELCKEDFKHINLVMQHVRRGYTKASNEIDLVAFSEKYHGVDYYVFTQKMEIRLNYLECGWVKMTPEMIDYYNGSFSNYFFNDIEITYLDKCGWIQIYYCDFSGKDTNNEAMWEEMQKIIKVFEYVSNKIHSDAMDDLSRVMTCVDLKD